MSRYYETKRNEKKSQRKKKQIHNVLVNECTTLVHKSEILYPVSNFYKGEISF